MKHSRTGIILVLVLILLLGGAYVLYNRLRQQAAPDQLMIQEQSEERAEGAEQGTETERISAPDFTVYDKDGNAARLSDYIGQPIVLNFWASWCGPCRMEMPGFHEKYQTLGEEIQFLMVNVTSGRETKDEASAFIAEQGYTFPVFYDTEADAAVTYGVYSLPVTYFIDAEGYLIAQAAGGIDVGILQKGIDMITVD